MVEKRIDGVLGLRKYWVETLTACFTLHPGKCLQSPVRLPISLACSNQLHAARKKNNLK